ncbi:MAG TPA: transglycosylase domain-containing protein [Longimicrobiaceae bacterium]|nr:transglycosylase domain-containing protein [Longimicrobiaceae bacterium]
MRAARGKRLGGAPRPGRWVRAAPPDAVRGERRAEILFLLALGFLLLGGVVGFAWEMDRQVRGGILRQRVEAARRPDWVPLERLPPALPRMVMAAADPRFAERRPLDAGGGAAEASIPRDLVTQVHLLENDLGGEARALLMAPLLQNRLGRRDILELYLNRVYFGRSGSYPVYGVRDAAREFFGKEPQQLSLGEMATLAGLLLPPRIEDPERAPGAVGARRNEVLRRMLEAGAVDAAAYRAASEEPLAFQPGADYPPMSRPLRWEEPPPALRLPALPSPADSAAARPGA